MQESTTYKIEGDKLTLSQLRTFLERTEHVLPTTVVNVFAFDNQRDGRGFSLSVTITQETM